MPFESPSQRKGTAQPFSLQVCAGIYIYHAVNSSVFFHFSLYRNANRLIKPNYFILSLHGDVKAVLLESRQEGALTDFLHQGFALSCVVRKCERVLVGKRSRKNT